MKKPYLLIITAILYLVLTAGMSLAKNSDAETIEALKQAVKINPDDADAHFNLGAAYFELGMYKETIEAYKQVIRINPDDADAHAMLGVAYGETGMYKEAIDAFKQAIRINPDDVDAHFCLGLAYVYLNDRGSALKQYKILENLDTELANELLKLINK